MSKSTTGFTFLEIIIVFGVVSLLAVTVSVSFSGLNGEQAVDKAALTVMSVLNGARSSAISSKGAIGYGVRIGSSKLTVFQGSYGIGNVDYTLSNLVRVSTSSGIGGDIIFQNVLGNTNASGTITVSLISDVAKNDVLRIYTTGAVERN